MSRKDYDLYNSLRLLAESIDNLVDAIQCLTNQIRIAGLLREAGESE